MCRPQLLKRNNISWSFTDFLVATEHFSPRSASLGGTGEPFLNKNLGEIVEHLSSKEIKPIVNTNGTLLNSAGSWLQKVHLIKVSLDAANEKTYEIIRKNTNFLEILSNIRKIVNLKVCRVRLEYVVMSTNYKELTDFVQLTKELAVEGAFFRLYQGMDLPEDLDRKFREVPEIERELRRANREAKSLNVKSNLPDLCKKFDYIRSRYARTKVDDERKRHTCLLPWSQLFIRADGEVSPCCDLLEIGHKSVGNVFKDKNVWNSTKMKDLRTIFRERKNYDLYETCQSCEFLDWRQILKWTKLVPRWF